MLLLHRLSATSLAFHDKDPLGKSIELGHLIPYKQANSIACFTPLQI